MFAFIFIIITLLCVLLFWLGTGKNKRVMLFLALWTGVIGILSYSGFYLNTTALPPRMAMVLLPSIVYVIYFYRTLPVEAIKLNYIVAVHVLRIPVEWTLYWLYMQKQIPRIMTFEGWNFDSVMGITALILLLYILMVKRKPNAAFFRIWNIAGIAFLSVIVTIALLSAPSPIQLLAFEQPNIAILTFPYTLLPAIVVPLVLVSHMLCLKQALTS